MFEQTFLAGAARTSRVWTVLASFFLQLAGLGVLVLIPLIITDTLPTARLMDRVIEPAPPVQKSGTRPEHVRIVEAAHLKPAAAGKTFRAPGYIPEKAARIVDPPQEAAAPSGLSGPYIPGLPDGPAGNERASEVMLRMLAQLEPRAPEQQRVIAQPRAIEAVKQVRVGGDVQEAKLIHPIIPEYPRLAVAARISGTVRLGAIIGADGRIRELRVISGHPLLAPAAVRAVQQWLYSPTLLNGVPCEVITTIDIEFTINRR